MLFTPKISQPRSKVGDEIKNAVEEARQKALKERDAAKRRESFNQQHSAFMGANPKYAALTARSSEKHSFTEDTAKVLSAPQTIAHGLMGLGVGATSMGWQDTLIANGRIQQDGIMKAMKADLRRTVEEKFHLEVVNDEKFDEWVVKHPDGKKVKFDPRPHMRKPTSRAELNAMWGGYEMSAEDRMAYNVGKFFGSFAIPGKLGRMGANALKLIPTVLGKIMTGTAASMTTGLLYETSEQLQERSKGKEFSFGQIARTGALFAVMGAATESLNAIVGARRLTQFVRKHPDLFDKNLTEAERKILVGHAREAANLAAHQRVEAVAKLRGLAKKQVLSANEAAFVKNADPLLRQAAKELSPGQMDALLKKSYMTQKELDAVYGKKIEAIMQKLDDATVAERSSWVMSEQAEKAKRAAQSGVKNVVKKSPNAAIQQAREVVGREAADISPAVKAAVERRNLDISSETGKILLAGYKPITHEEIAARTERAKESIAENKERIARLEALPEDADIPEVRKAVGFTDSGAVDRNSEIAKWENIVADSEQYIADMQLVDPGKSAPQKQAVAIQKAKEKIQGIVKKAPVVKGKPIKRKVYRKGSPAGGPVADVRGVYYGGSEIDVEESLIFEPQSYNMPIKEYEVEMKNPAVFLDTYDAYKHYFGSDPNVDFDDWTEVAEMEGLIAQAAKASGHDWLIFKSRGGGSPGGGNTEVIDLGPVKVGAPVEKLRDGPTEAVQPPEQTGEKVAENPFSSWTDEELLSLKASGLSMDEFNAELSTRGLMKEKFASSMQKKNIFSAAVDLGLGGEKLENMILAVSGGRKQALDDLSFSEANEVLVDLSNLQSMEIDRRNKLIDGRELIVERNMPTKDHETLFKILGKNHKAFNEGMLWIKARGGAPDPTRTDIPDAKGQYDEWFRDVKRIFKERAIGIQQQKDVKGTAKKVNWLNEWQNVYHALDKMGMRTGVPEMGRLWRTMVGEARAKHYENALEIKGLSKRAGATMLGKAHDPTANHLIYQWSNAQEGAKEEFWNRMTPETQALALEIDKWWQGEGANLTRWAEWVRWNRVAGEVADEIGLMNEYGMKISKSQMKKFQARVKAVQPSNAPQEALNDGRLAMEKGENEFGIWIESQTWGTRENYAPMVHHMDSLVDELLGVQMPGKMVREELQRTLGTEPVPGHIKPRKGEGGELRLTDNVILDIHNHADRTVSYIIAQKYMPDFQKRFIAAGASDQDIENAKIMVKAFLGLPAEHTKAIVRLYIEGNKAMWRALFSDYAFSFKFAVRQAFQNPAFFASQFPIDEIAASAIRFPHVQAFVNWFKLDSEGRKGFQDWFRGNIAENRAMKNFMILKGGTLSGIEAKGRLAAILDSLGFAPSLTDLGNRHLAWPVAWEIGKRNWRLLHDGSISMKEFVRRTGLDVLTPTQSLRLKEMVKDGDELGFRNLLAEYKTENVHGRYHPLMRSVQEMDVTGRTIMGLIPFPRIVANIALKNSYEQMLRGDAKSFTRGLSTLIKLIGFSSVASYGYYKATGDNAYDTFNTIFGYHPGSIGLNQMQEMDLELKDRMYEAEQNGEDPITTGKKLLLTFESNLEVFIPFVRTTIREREIRTDKDHQHMHDVLKAAYNLALNKYELEFGEKWNYRRRSTREKLFYRLFGVDRKPRKSEYDDLNKALKGPKDFGEKLKNQTEIEMFK